MIDGQSKRQPFSADMRCEILGRKAASSLALRRRRHQGGKVASEEEYDATEAEEEDEEIEGGGPAEEHGKRADRVTSHDRTNCKQRGRPDFRLKKIYSASSQI